MAKNYLTQVKRGKYPTTDRYAKNVSRSFGYYVKDLIKTNLPVFDSYREDNPEDDIKFSRRDLKAKRLFNYFFDAAGGNVVFKDAKTAWRNAKTSIKSGRYYDTRRAAKAESEGMKAAFGLDLDFKELDELENYDPDKDLNQSEEDLNNMDDFARDLDNSFRGGANQLTEASMAGSEYVAGTIKASSSLAYGQSMRTLKVMGQGFGNLSNQLVALNKFNQEQIQTHIKNSAQYFESVTSLLAEQNGMLKEILDMKRNMYEQARSRGDMSTGDIYDEIIDSSGRINFSAYKKSFEHNLENGPFSMVPMFYNMFAKEFAANPIQFMMTQLITSLGGDKAEKALQRLQRTIVGSLGTLNARLLQAGDEGGYLGEILSLFGIREERHKIVHTEFEKGPMQFNGAANKAITEVIPTYLARIEAAITGGPIKLYDMDKGLWTTSKEVRTNFEKKKAYSGNNVDEIVYDQFTKVAEADKIYFSDAEKREIQRLVSKEIIPHLKKSSAVINKNEIIDGGIVEEEFLDKIGLSGKKVTPRVKTIIAEIFKNMPTEDLLALAGAARSDRMSESDIVAEVSNNPNSVYKYLFNGALNGTIDSKYHIEKNSELRTVVSDQMSISNEIVKSREVLKAIYNELFNFHTTVVNGGGIGTGGNGSRKRQSFDEFGYNDKDLSSYQDAMWVLDDNALKARRKETSKHSFEEVKKKYEKRISKVEEYINDFNSNDRTKSGKHMSLWEYINWRAKEDDDDKVIDFIKTYGLNSIYDSSTKTKFFMDNLRGGTSDKDIDKKMDKELGKKYTLEELSQLQIEKYEKAKKEFKKNKENEGKTFMSFEQFVESKKFDKNYKSYKDFEKSINIEKLTDTWSREWESNNGLAPTKEEYIEQKLREEYFNFMKKRTKSYIKDNDLLKKERVGRIDFENVFAQMDEEYRKSTELTDYEGYNPLQQEIFGNREIKIDTKDTTVLKKFEKFFEYIKDHTLAGIDWKDKEVRDFCYMTEKLPDEFYTGNTHLDQLVKECKKGNYATIFGDKNNDILRKAVYAIKYQYSKKEKKEGDYKNLSGDELSESIQKSLNKENRAKYEDDDSYKEYKGSDFFSKLSKASGLDKLGVIHSGLRKLISKPLNWILDKINGIGGNLGRLISGDLSAFGDLLPSLDERGMAFGGPIKQTGLYVLSKGEKVIPTATPNADAKKESAYIDSLKAAGFPILGGRAYGTDARDKVSIMDVVRRTFGHDEINMKDLDFREKVKQIFRGPGFEELTSSDLKYIDNAIDTNQADKLEIILHGITAAEIYEKAKKSADYIFGTAKDLGKKVLDFLPDSIKNNIEEIGRYGAWGAVAGVASGMIGGPFGILGGALLGSATGFIHHSKSLQDLLFGPNLGENIKTVFGKNAPKFATIGGTVGGLIGGPFGVVGGAMLGTAYSFLDSSDTFRKIMFGPKGIIARIDHFFGKDFADTRKSLVDYIKEAVTRPIENAMVPVGTALQVGFRETFKLVDKGLRNLVKPTFAQLANQIFGQYKDNKFVTGAIGGGVGGALMGGPVGAIMGGIIGSVAHGTGLDKKLSDLGKIPGSLLNRFSGYLSRKEIESGNAFNWTASERINKMKELNKNDDYEKTGRGQFDVMLAKAGRGDIVKTKMLLKMATGRDPELDKEINEAIYHLDHAMAISGVGNDTKKAIIDKIKEKSMTVNADDIWTIINEDPNMSTEEKETLILPGGEFMKALAEYKQIAVFVEQYKDLSPEQLKQSAINRIGVDNKDELEKHLRYVSKQNQVMDKDFDALKATKQITVTTALLDHSKMVNAQFVQLNSRLDAILYQYNHPEMDVTVDKDGVMIVNNKQQNISTRFEKNGTKTIRSTSFEPNGVRKVTIRTVDANYNIVDEREEFYGKDGSKINDPSNQERLDASSANTKAEAEELKEEEAQKAKTDKIIDLLTPMSKNAEEDMRSRTLAGRLHKAGSMLKGGIGGALKLLGKALGAPFVGVFNLFNAVFDSIPFVGDLWNAIKNRGFNAASWLSKRLGSVFKGTKTSMTTKAGKWLQGTSLYAGAKNWGDYFWNMGRKANPGEKAGSLFDMAGPSVWNGSWGRKLSKQELSWGMLNKYKSLGEKFGFGKDSLWFSPENMQRWWKIFKGTGGLISGTAGTLVRAGSGIARMASKVSGKLLGGALKFGIGMVDAMAIDNAINDARKAEISASAGQDTESLLTSISGWLAGIASSIPLLGDIARDIRDNQTGGGLVEEGLSTAADVASDYISGKKGKGKGKGVKGAVGKKGIRGFLGRNKKNIAAAALTIGAGYLATKTGMVSEETATDAAETVSQASRITTAINMAIKALYNILNKISPKYAMKLWELEVKIIKTLCNPKTLKLIGVKILGKMARFLVGPVGWVWMAGSASYSFYQGYNNAEKLWQAKAGEEIGISKKIVCGLTMAVADLCCLDLIMNENEIMQFVKNAIGYTEETSNEAAKLASINNNGMTVLNLKEIANKLDSIKFNPLGKLWEGTKAAFGGLKDILGTIVDNIKKKFDGIIDGAKEYIGKVADWFNNFSIKDVFSGALQSAKDFINKFFSGIDEKDKGKLLTDKKTSEKGSGRKTTGILDAQKSETELKNEKKLTSIWDWFKVKKDNAPTTTKPIKSYSLRSRAALGGTGDGGFFGKGDGGNNAERIWNYLASKGLGSAAIAGIMGNMQQESGFMPNRVQGYGVKTAPEITVDGQTGYGLCQWTYPTRQQALLDYARSKGKSSSDLETQLDFMLMEATQRDKGLFGRMANMSAHAAAKEFHDSYEGSADDAAGVSKRGDFAEAIYKTQGKGIRTAGTFESSGGGGGGSFGTSSSSSSGGGLFSSVAEALGNSSIGRLGEALFGDKNFFFSGIANFGSGSSGGAGSGRSVGGNYSFEGGRTGTSRIVNNMRSLIGKISYHAPDGTNCMRTCGIALKGTPYEGMINVDVAKAKAQELKQLHSPGDGYTPKAADMCIVNNGNHMVMLTETGGTIQNGSSHNGVYESKQSPQQMFGKVDYYISSSIYDSVEDGKGNSVVDFLTKSLNGNITGKYNESRDGGPHGGIDIGAAAGTIIKSPISGQVTKIAYEPGGYGQYLQIKDNKGNYHLFAHLDKAPNFDVGKEINAGDELAKVGSSGLSTGPHLHYQIDPAANKDALKTGAHIDPNTYNLDPAFARRINENNNATNIADFKRMQDTKPGDGDGGFLDAVKDRLEFSPKDYTDKFDAIIQLLTTMVQLLQGGVAKPAPAPVGDAMTAAIPIMRGADNMLTTTPGKSIMNIIGSMLKIAED